MSRPATEVRAAQEIAEVVAFLAGPGAASITGQTIVVDGGFTLVAA